MPKLQLTSQIELELDEILNSVSLLDTATLEQFTEKVLALRANRYAPSLRASEAKLLQKINLSVPVAVRERFNHLNEKLHNEVITPEEHQELLQLVEQIEMADVARLKAMVELARLRNVSVDTLMQQLGIHFGQATTEALQLNRTGVFNLRQILYLMGKHPPRFEEQ